MSRAEIVDLRWSALLNDFRRSGLTQVEFCRRRDISLHSFRKRLYAARTSKPTVTTRGPAPATSPDFLPVTILSYALRSPSRINMAVFRLSKAV
jgi:hypothetical protein